MLENKSLGFEWTDLCVEYIKTAKKTAFGYNAKHFSQSGRNNAAPPKCWDNKRYTSLNRSASKHKYTYTTII